MKTKTLIFLVFFLANIGYLFAQDDVYGAPQTNNSNKINTGFVFINGKYIDAPYKIKIKNKILYINNIPVTTPLNPIKNPFEGYDKHLKKPPCLNKNSTLDDLRNCRESSTNLTYYDYMNCYYLKRYSFERAQDSLVEYIRSLPNVKSFEKQDNGFWEMVLYDGEESGYALGGVETRRKSKIWGPGGKGKKIERKKRALNLKAKEELIERILSKDNVILISNNFSNYYQYQDVLKLKLSRINNIIQNEQITFNQKEDSLKKLIYNENFSYDLIQNYNVSKQFLERLSKEDNKKNGSLLEQNKGEIFKKKTQNDVNLKVKSVMDEYLPKNNIFNC